MFLVIDPRGRPQSRPVVITNFTQSVHPSVRPSQNFKFKRQSLPAGTVVGLVDHWWPVLFLLNLNIIKLKFSHADSVWLWSYQKFDRLGWLWSSHSFNSRFLGSWRHPLQKGVLRHGRVHQFQWQWRKSQDLRQGLDGLDQGHRWGGTTFGMSFKDGRLIDTDVFKVRLNNVLGSLISFWSTRPVAIIIFAYVSVGTFQTIA